jgi:hypothetical protein
VVTQPNRAPLEPLTAAGSKVFSFPENSFGCAQIPKPPKAEKSAPLTINPRAQQENPGLNRLKRPPALPDPLYMGCGDSRQGLSNANKIVSTESLRSVYVL